jgi:hypothetical protein
MPSYDFSPAPTLDAGDIIAGDAGLRGKDQILIGQLAEAGPRRQLWLDISGEQVVAVLGKRGTGKSYTLGVILEGLAAGVGDTPLARKSTPRAALVLDIMDIFWSSTIPLRPGGSEELERQYKSLLKSPVEPTELGIDVWIPAGFTRPDIDPAQVGVLSIKACELSLDDWSALFSVDIYTGEPRGNLVADCIRLTSVSGYENTSGEDVAPNADFDMSDLLECLDNSQELLTNYQDGTIRSIRQRLVTYEQLPLFAGAGTTLSEILNPFRVSILMLARLPDALKRVVVAVLLRRIARERRDASLAQKRLDLDTSLAGEERLKLKQLVSDSIPRTWVLLDEAHVLAGAGESTVASEALVKFAKEGRNYGLSLAVATQQPSALDSRLMSQVETVLTHQLTSPEDAAIATRACRSPLPESIRVDGVACEFPGLLRRLGQGQACFSSGNAPLLQRSCVVSVRPRITAHGGYET